MAADDERRVKATAARLTAKPTHKPTIRNVAERVRRAVARLEVPDDGGTPVPLTISIGLASVHPRDMTDHDTLPTRLLGAADAALYAAKRSGRDRVVVAA